MLTELRTAIYSIGSTVSGSNNVYYEVEPQTVTYPYTVYFLVNDNINRVTTNGKTDSNIIIQFSCFDRRLLDNGNLNSAVSLERMAEELITKFEASTITVSGYRLYDKRIQFVRPAKIVDEKYWQIIIQYLLLFEKT